MFEKAVRMKLRFTTVGKGTLSVEDLWDLPLKELNKLAKSLNKLVKSVEEEDFLQDKSAEDREAKFAFDLVLYVLNTLKTERDAKKAETTTKAEKQKWMERIERKENEAEEGLSLKEMKVKLAELG